jgi:hypothetical protein
MQPLDNKSNLIIDWINTESWDQSRQVLIANADYLLSDEALEALDLMMLAENGEEEEEDKTRKNILRQHRALLERARADSIDAAYVDLLQPPSLSLVLQNAPEQFRDALRAIVGARGPAEVVQRLGEHPLLLTSEALPVLVLCHLSMDG